MNVIESLEVRWFFAQDLLLVEELNEWFGDVPLEAGDRTDHYYFDRQKPSLNAKDRGGPKGSKLEFKYRTGSLGATCLAPGVQGDLERWTKLSFQLGADTKETLASFSGSVAVKKARRLRKFEYSGGQASPVAADKMPSAGCGVELTSVEATRAGQVVHAVSFGLEAFGSSEVIFGALLSTASALFGERPGLKFTAADSHNYSSWLIRKFAAE
jgi:hypothetical protein